MFLCVESNSLVNNTLCFLTSKIGERNKRAKKQSKFFFDFFFFSSFFFLIPSNINLWFSFLGFQFFDFIFWFHFLFSFFFRFSFLFFSFLFDFPSNIFWFSFLVFIFCFHFLIFSFFRGNGGGFRGGNRSLKKYARPPACAIKCCRMRNREISILIWASRHLGVIKDFSVLSLLSIELCQDDSQLTPSTWKGGLGSPPGVGEGLDPSASRISLTLQSLWKNQTKFWFSFSLGIERPQMDFYDDIWLNPPPPFYILFFIGRHLSAGSFFFFLSFRQFSFSFWMACGLCPLSPLPSPKKRTKDNQNRSNENRANPNRTNQNWTNQNRTNLN